MRASPTPPHRLYSLRLYRLINWKDPISDNGYRFSGSSSSTSAGDLPSAIEDALRDRIYIDDATAAPTVGDVNSILDLLASSKDKVNIFQLKVLNRFTASEQKWLVRIVLGEMKVSCQYLLTSSSLLSSLPLTPCRLSV